MLKQGWCGGGMGSLYSAIYTLDIAYTLPPYSLYTHLTIAYTHRCIAYILSYYSLYTLLL